MTLLLVLLGCDPADPAVAEPAEHVEHAAPSDNDHSDHKMHAGVDGRPHHGGDHATVTHRFDDAEKWSEVFDDPARDAWQKPAELIAALDIQPGSTVSDIGAGTGYFSAHLSRAVGEQGSVIAVDIEETLVAHMTKRVETEGTVNVSPRLGTADDPGLTAEEADLILLVDTYHHIGDRTVYFTRLLDALKPGGRLVVVDFKPGDLPVGPPPEHRIPQEKVLSELTTAGWLPGESLDVLPHQFVQVVAKPGA